MMCEHHERKRGKLDVKNEQRRQRYTNTFIDRFDLAVVHIARVPNLT